MIEYDAFAAAFLAKVTEFDFASILDEEIRTEILDGYMKTSMSAFNRMCELDLSSNANDYLRCYDVEIEDSEVDEIVDIISEGMVVQWLKPYANAQDLLQQCLNTVDFQTYSPGELLRQVRAAYTQTKKDFRAMMHDYTYFHGDLTELHL